MATPEDIQIVRDNTDEQDSAGSFTDEAIGLLIDALGISGASYRIWEQKAAKFSTLADVTEAGASHKFSNVYDNAMKMLAYWRKKYEDENGGSTSGGRPMVKKIIRE